MRLAYCVATWSGFKLVETISHIPKGSRCLVVDNSQLAWPLAKAWNYGINRLCVQEGYDVAVVMNDDVVLRDDTGPLLAEALTSWQFEQREGGPELLVLSARHAAPTDARTDEADWELLEGAAPEFQPGPDFACFATTRKLLNIVGPFDEQFNPCFFEDNDMHRRIQLAGYEAGAYAPYWHFLNGTTRTDSERRSVIQATFEENKARYVRKWGGIPGRERYAVPYGQPVPV